MSAMVEMERAFHRGTAALFELLTPEQTRRLAALPPDPELQPRVEELAGKANEGTLTDTEREEYEGYIEANNVIAVLQSQARARIGA